MLARVKINGRILVGSSLLLSSLAVSKWHVLILTAVDICIYVCQYADHYRNDLSHSYDYSTQLNSANSFPFMGGIMHGSFYMITTRCSLIVLRLQFMSE